MGNKPMKLWWLVPYLYHTYKEQKLKLQVTFQAVKQIACRDEWEIYQITCFDIFTKLSVLTLCVQICLNIKMIWPNYVLPCMLQLFHSVCARSNANNCQTEEYTFLKCLKQNIFFTWLCIKWLEIRSIKLIWNKGSFN